MHATVRLEIKDKVNKMLILTHLSCFFWASAEPLPKLASRSTNARGDKEEQVARCCASHSRVVFCPHRTR